jgi:hypothetical protein
LPNPRSESVRSSGFGPDRGRDPRLAIASGPQRLSVEHADISSMLMVGIAVVTFLIIVIVDGIRADLTAVLSRILENLTRAVARHVLPSEDAQAFIDWLECELSETRDRDGSGIGVVIFFLVCLGPRFVHQAQKSRRSPKR